MVVGLSIPENAYLGPAEKVKVRCTSLVRLNICGVRWPHSNAGPESAMGSLFECPLFLWESKKKADRYQSVLNFDQ